MCSNIQDCGEGGCEETDRLWVPHRDYSPGHPRVGWQNQDYVKKY